MIAAIFLLETARKNLLLGFMPEPLGLLIFGAVLVALPVGLRRVFNRSEQETEKFPAGKAQKTQSAQREF